MDALAAANNAAVQMMIDTAIVGVDQHRACITRNRVQSMGRSTGWVNAQHSCGRYQSSPR